MQCPACSHYDAYTGLQWVHCRNAECRYYDKKYDEERSREELGPLLADIEVDEEPKPSEHDIRVQRFRDLMSGKRRRP